MNRFITPIVVGITSLLLVSCAATSTAIEHRNLSVQSKMSESVFLTPVSASQRTVYVQVRNTSDKSSFNIEPMLSSAISAKGYDIVHDIDKAHYLLQVNVLKAEQMTPGQADDALSKGFGGAVLGGLTGSIASDGDAGTTLAGAVVGGLISTVANSMVKNVNYVVVTDVQLSERSSKPISESRRSNLKQGDSTVEKQTSVGGSDWKKYRTRLTSTANKVNLKFEEAEPELEKGVATAIAGML